MCSVPLLARAALTYYTLADFQWYVRHDDGSKQRTELLSQLSRRQVLVGVLWSDAAERHRKLQAVQAVLRQPSMPLPPLRQIAAGPSGPSFATYVLTTADDQSLAGVAVLLNTLHSVQVFDYALPVLQLSRGPAAPFVEFTASFAPAVAAESISGFLRGQSVTVLRQNGRDYTFRLQPHAVTNIFAVIRAFEEASNLVANVQPVWLDVSVPQSTDLAAAVPRPSARLQPPSSSPTIAAHVTLDTGWEFSLVDVREPIRYQLQIERSAQVHIVPESIAATALRRALAQETAVPPELFDITEASTHTEALPGDRIRQHVHYILRISKPGTYRIPALQIAYSLDDSRRTTRQVQSLPAPGYLVTVDAHLPLDTSLLPGDILGPLRLAEPVWRWFRPLALGLAAAGVCLCLIGIVLTTPRPQRAAKMKPLSLQQIRQRYQTALRPLQERMPTTTGPLTAETRAWLRDCAALIRRLLGEWATGDPSLFEGGAGISATMIMAHLHAITTKHDALLEPFLRLLHELDTLATAPAPTLAPEDYQRFAEEVYATMLALTNHEATRRVLRTPTRV